MITSLDHIIIGVSDLEEATRIFGEKLGLKASGGGVHPSVGTANRIIVFGDTYIELITINNPAEAQEGQKARLAKGDGYLNCVLGSNDIEAEAQAMRKRGVHMLGPTSGMLTSEDGRSRGWSRINIERPDMVQRYPFVIQHDSTGEERRFRLAGWNEPPLHPLGAKKVRDATIAVNDLREATQRFQHIYGLQPSSNYTGEADVWDAMLVAFPLDQSGQSLELAEPLPLETGLEMDASAAQLPAMGSLAQYLRTFGESLCRITLLVESLDASRRYLDKRRVTYTYNKGDHEAGEQPNLWIAPSEACGAAIVLHEDVEDVDNPLI